MSVITRITNTQIVDREFLIKALEDLGYAWEEGGGLGLRGAQLDIKLKGFAAGFTKSGGYYSFIARGRRQAVKKKTQKDLKRIVQRYVYHAARAKLEAQGFTLAQEDVKEDGQIHLILRRMT